MLAALSKHGKVLTIDEAENVDVEAGLATEIQVVVAEFVRRVYTGFDERKVQAYCDKQGLTVFRFKRRLCHVILTRLQDAAPVAGPQREQLED